jgi:hypothetical protein
MPFKIASIAVRINESLPVQALLKHRRFPTVSIIDNKRLNVGIGDCIQQKTTLKHDNEVRLVRVVIIIIIIVIIIVVVVVGNNVEWR